MGPRAAGAGLQLDEGGVEFLLGDLLVDSGESGACLEFLPGVLEFGAAFEELLPVVKGLLAGVRGIGGGLKRAVLVGAVEERDRDLNADGDGV